MGVTVSFYLPALNGEHVYLHVPSDVVMSDEGKQSNEEYTFTPSQYWTLATGKLHLSSSSSSFTISYG